MTALGFKQGFCEKCGGTEFYKDKRCKQCAKEYQRNYLQKADRPCSGTECDAFCAVGRHYCTPCGNLKNYNLRQRSNRPCPTKGCKNFCKIGRGYCQTCDLEYHRKNLKNPYRPCPTKSCNNFCLIGDNYCRNCRIEGRQRRQSRIDRPCPVEGCNNFCNIGEGYCKSCRNTRGKIYKSDTVRPCPTDGCDNYCKVGGAFCVSCGKIYFKTRLEKGDRLCPGEDCNNFCTIGSNYCQKCDSARGQLRRQREYDAEGSHTGKEQTTLMALFNDLCLECLVDGEIRQYNHADHIQSLFNGGSNGIYNIQPLCQFHNSSKHTDNVRYIETALVMLNIPIDDYLNVVGLSHSNYSYLLEWWDNLGVKANNKFQWEVT